MGETLFNTFSFDFIKKKSQEDDDYIEKPRKPKKKKKQEPMKAAEDEPKPGETKPGETKPGEPIPEGSQPTTQDPIQAAQEGEYAYAPLRARPSDLPDPNDPASNFFTNPSRNVALSDMREVGNNGPSEAVTRPRSATSSLDVEEKFMYNRRFMYDSKGDLVSYD